MSCILTEYEPVGSHGGPVHYIFYRYVDVLGPKTGPGGPGRCLKSFLDAVRFILNECGTSLSFEGDFRGLPLKPLKTLKTLFDVFFRFWAVVREPKRKNTCKMLLIPHIAIIFRNAPNIICYRLPLTNTRPLSRNKWHLMEALYGVVPYNLP